MQKPMRRLLLGVGIALCSVTSYAQAPFTELFPYPTDYNGEDVIFLDDQLGFSIHEFVILRTQDGGATWANLGYFDKPKVMKFVGDVGYVMANYGLLYRSTDRGSTWSRVTTPKSSLYPFQQFEGISVISADSVVVAAQYEVLFTGDGGENWEVLETRRSADLYGEQPTDVHFFNPQEGLLAMRSGKIFRTENGGDNWTVVEETNISPSEYTTLYLVNDTLGFAGRERNKIFKTIDAGHTWSEVSAVLPATPTRFSFANDQVGMAILDPYEIWKTTDGGDNWTSVQSFSSLGTNGYLDGIYMLDEQKIVVNGANGKLITSLDGGTTWTDQSFYFQPIQTLTFTSTNNAFLHTEGSFVYHSADRGRNWTLRNDTSASVNLSAVEFISDEVAFALSTGLDGAGSTVNKVYTSQDAGVSWTKTHASETVNGEEIFSMDFLSETEGYVATGTEVLKTADGGATWTVVSSMSFQRLKFSDANMGYGVSFNNIDTYSLHVTTDGGATWDELLATTDEILDFDFQSASNGIVIGKNGSNYRTLDGGNTWNPMSGLPANTDLEKIYFTNALLGYLSASNGVQYRTGNGGESWQQLGSYGRMGMVRFENEFFLYGDQGELLVAPYRASDLVLFGGVSIRSVTDSIARFTWGLTNLHDESEVRVSWGADCDNFDTTYSFGTWSHPVVDSVLSIKLDGLSPNTSYCIKLEVQSGDLVITSGALIITTNKSPIEDFVSIDSLTSSNISNITSEGAEVSVNITSQLDSVTVQWDWEEKTNSAGRSVSYVLYGPVDTTLSETLTGLSPETEYAVTFTASTSSDALVSNEVIFRTLAQPFEELVSLTSLAVSEISDSSALGTIQISSQVDSLWVDWVLMPDGADEQPHTILLTTTGDTLLTQALVDLVADTDYSLWVQAYYGQDTLTTELVSFRTLVDSSEEVLSLVSFMVDWSLYPNPVNEQLTLGGLDGKYHMVEVLDLTGKHYFTQKLSVGIENFTINVRQLQPGIYLLRLTNSQGTLETQRFVKE